MFQTERLQQIIDQLRNAEGMGYFDTLKLVLQLIGIFIGPVLAEFFNGGGHRNASGGKLLCSIQEAEQIPVCRVVRWTILLVSLRWIAPMVHIATLPSAVSWHFM